jgi:hypothetical protein
MEIWKPIPGFSRYEASSLGRLKSLNYKRTGTERVLKPGLSPDGYLKTVLLRDSGKYHSWTVHLFIAMAFYGIKPEGKEINHINGTKTDNRPENLEYITHSQNCQHSFDTGLQQPKVGSLNGFSKLTEEQVKEIREYRKSIKSRYYGRERLAQKYGVSSAHIKDIVTRRRNAWHHI